MEFIYNILEKILPFSWVSYDFMKNAFDGECKGSLEYLEETALEQYARNVRKEGKNFFGKYYKIKGRGYADDEL